MQTLKVHKLNASLECMPTPDDLNIRICAEGERLDLHVTKLTDGYTYVHVHLHPMLRKLEDLTKSVKGTCAYCIRAMDNTNQNITDWARNQGFALTTTSA